MKVTFITGHLCKERHALLYELALDLGENGAEVTVLTGFPSRRVSKQVRDYYLAHPIEHISKNVVVKRIGSRGGEGEGLLDRMIKYLQLTKVLYKEAKKTPTDVYYIYSSPPFLGWMGAKLAKNAPTLYNAQDLFPDTLIRIKGLKESNPLVKFLRYKEKKAYKGNTRIVTISNEMKETIVSHGCPKEKIDVIYNWADTDTLHHVERKDNALMDELGIEKKGFIVSYAGDIGLFQGWPVIIDAAQMVHEKNKDIRFVIIGSGSYKQKLEEQIKSEGLDYISTYPLQPATRLSEVYSVGDLELVSIEPGLSKVALPSKTFVIMATGSTVLSLVDQSSDIATIIKKNDLGYTIEHGNPNQLEEIILEAYINQECNKRKGENAKQWVDTYASRKRQTNQYFEILKMICE